MSVGRSVELSFAEVCMDHEPGYGSVALANDLGRAPCPLSLSFYGFPGERKTL